MDRDLLHVILGRGASLLRERPELLAPALEMLERVAQSPEARRHLRTVGGELSALLAVAGSRGTPTHSSSMRGARSTSAGTEPAQTVWSGTGISAGRATGPAHL